MPSELYAVLGLKFGSDTRQIAVAYRKRSLLHHPDRGGDVKKFLELKNARDVLMDPKQKKEYDQKISIELEMQHQREEREAELDDKRRKMRQELLGKEREFELRKKSAVPKSELNALREKALSRQKDLEQRQRNQRESFKEKKERAKKESSSSRANRTITVKWERNQHLHSDDTLNSILREYGEIEAIKMKNSSATVIFRTASAASNAVCVEGHKACWRSVSLHGHLVHVDTEINASKHNFHHKSETVNKSQYQIPMDPVTLKQHLSFEKHVLGKLQAAAQV